ncbi:MAG: hypothetical protein WCY30_05265 [Candidatus Neomarinimicrobiota bacterium]|jgi:DNA-directed RNA polymerase specialized sigma subunit
MIIWPRLDKFAGLFTKGDTEAWKKWQTTGSQDDLENLFKNFEGIITTAVKKYSSQRMPTSAIRTEAERLALGAFRTYNPSMGASLATHVNNNLLKLYGFVARYSDIAKVPEKRYSGVRRFNDAERILREKFKREPNAAEIADYLQIPVSEVGRYRQEGVQILSGSGISDFSNIDVGSDSLLKKYALSAVYFDLEPEEKIVYEYVYGMAGKKQTGSTGEIATKTGMSPSKISRLKKKIADKIEKYL